MIYVSVLLILVAVTLLVLGLTGGSSALLIGSIAASLLAAVALVIGANDVTNPAARSVPDSPIYGMPILDVDKAQSVVVLKRSMNSGFAGIDNPLFYDPKTSMLFGDAKASVSDIVAEVQAL